MIIEDNNFQIMVEEINECIGEAFERAEEYSEIFEVNACMFEIEYHSIMSSFSVQLGQTHSPIKRCMWTAESGLGR